MAILEDLPLEVLALCFLPLPLRHRVTASHVSKRWRAASIMTPRLWSALNFNHRPEQRDVFLEILKRSGCCPLDASWTFQRSECFGFDILEANMWRVRRLAFNIHPRYPAYDHHIPDSLLMSAAPMLEVLHVDLRGCFTIPSQWDDGGAPRLREILVNSFKFDSNCRRFSALQRFRGRLADSEFDYLSRMLNGRERDSAGVHTIFDLCPQLVDLELGGLAPFTRPDVPRRTIPPTITRLAFYASWTTIDYGPLLDSLMRLPQSLTLPNALDFCSALKIFDAYARKPFTVTFRTVRSSPDESSMRPDAYSIRLCDDTSCTLTSTMVDVPAALDCVPGAGPYWGSLGSLECPAEFFDRLLKLRQTLPMLQSLTIAISGRRPFGDLNYCHFQRSGHVVVPQLRTLSIDTTDIDRHFATGAHSWFLQTLPRTLPAWLHLGQPKLAAVLLFLSQESPSTAVAVSPQVLLPRTDRIFVGWRDGWEHEIEGRGKWYPDQPPRLAAV